MPAVGQVRRLKGGARFGKYEIVRHLATGGMAELYLARARGIEGFEKLVVLKQILGELAGNDSFVRMFLDEARLAAKLHHPNIVQVFDIDAADGGYFFTMEWIHGYDARAILKRCIERQRRLPIECAIAIVIGAAAGLHHAHETRDANGRWLGIVHRDVSPSNILVTFDGAVKVADFGIAKAATQSSETRTGTLKGKISYMSPEQCRTETLDRRSDVFSLGVVLHELTTGRRLYTGDGDFQIMEKIVHADAPRPTTIVEGYPEALEHIVMNALARDRDARTPTTQALQRQLEAFARQERLEVSSLALAALMNELFADEAAPPDAASGADAATRITRAAVTAHSEARVTAVGTSEKTRPTAPGPRRRTRWWIGAGGAAAALTVVTMRLAITRPPPEPSPSLAPAVTPVPEVHAPPVEQPTAAPAHERVEPLPAPAPSPPVPTPARPTKPSRPPAITRARPAESTRDAAPPVPPDAPAPTVVVPVDAASPAPLDLESPIP